jgi:hypothetical protein
MKHNQINQTPWKSWHETTWNDWSHLTTLWPPCDRGTSSVFGSAFRSRQVRSASTLPDASAWQHSLGVVVSQLHWVDLKEHWKSKWVDALFDVLCSQFWDNEWRLQAIWDLTNSCRMRCQNLDHVYCPEPPVRSSYLDAAQSTCTCTIMYVQYMIMKGTHRIHHSQWKPWVSCALSWLNTQNLIQYSRSCTYNIIYI